LGYTLGGVPNETMQLHAGDVTVTVAPEDGGRLAQISVGGIELLIDDPDRGPLQWGSYPMAPWAGRLRDGRFDFDGQTYRMPTTPAERWLGEHAIHGTSHLDAWTLVDASRDQLSMECALSWSLGGTAHQHLVLTDTELVCILGVRAGGLAMPAVVGWHPWFRKPQRAEFSFRRWYPRDEAYITDGRLADPPPMTTPGSWDDCFLDALSPPTMWIDGLRVQVHSDCDHWVVYDQPTEATCVEPQSGPPDAFNLSRDGSCLATRLEPGELLQRTMRVTWGRAATGG
jgi:aldose 1-epimerase